MRLKNKIALITGASRGIGAAVARRFAKEGAQLILVARNTRDLETIDDQLREFSEGALLVPLDLMEVHRIDELAKAVHKRFGGLDILVGNAGMLGGLMPLPQYPPEQWYKVMRLNLDANWHLIRAFDGMLRASPQGRALFTTSQLAKEIIPYCGPYATSKAALEMMVRTYAAEVKKTNLRVNLIDPGATYTKMLMEGWPGIKPESIPHPDDITESFVLLAEDACPHHAEILKARDFMLSS